MNIFNKQTIHQTINTQYRHRVNGDIVGILEPNHKSEKLIGSIDQIDGSGSKSANTGILFFCKDIKTLNMFMII